MSYIPVLKNKMHEKNVLKKYNDYLSDNIIPLIEIIKREFKSFRKRDENGKCVRELVDGVNKYVIDYKEDFTIKKILTTLSGKSAFIDFFRFDPDVYGDYNDKMNWSVEISSSWQKYIDCFDEIAYIDNLYPVISLKENIDINFNEILGFIENQKSIKSIIAIRVSAEFYNNNYDLVETIATSLRNGDFFIFDINENSFEGYSDDLDDIVINEDIICNKILISSPRERKIYNSNFDVGINETAIAKSFVHNYRELGIDGFGDYLGIADCIEAGFPGHHAATLIYDLEKQTFYSARVQGKNFVGLKSLILNWSNLNKPQYQECLGVKKITDSNCIDFGSWKEVTMLIYMGAMIKSL